MTEGEEIYEALLRSAVVQLKAWANKYGQHGPSWLPPGGDLQLVETIDDWLVAAPAKAEQPSQATSEPKCSDNPDAPHGFNRNASHMNGRYTCDCEGWQDPMYEQAVQLVREQNRASISLVQRHLRIRYNRAATLIDTMARAGLINSNNDGSYILAAIAKATDEYS